jgi:hypothetical protein
MNKSENANSSEENELARLIYARIEKLRLKLLDLTRRNPLLNTRFSDRSHSHVRVVDELPQLLLEKMMNGSMQLVPLPPIEEIPKDENTQEFQSAFCAARQTDEVYLGKLESMDHRSEESAEQLVTAERDLRDRLRVELGLHPRQTRTNIKLVHHARNNHIRPEYELPLLSETHSDGRHDDDLIQTLLLPDLFERRLNSIRNKCNTWSQETGISVLKTAFGFVEWKDKPTSDVSLAPLILLPVELERKKTQSGYKYSVNSQDENPEANTVLIEKMKLEGLEFPVFDPEQMTVEDYFDKVKSIKLQGKQFVVRRQVAIGVFPSARMAMYYDLDTKMWEFIRNDVVKELLGGSSENTTDTPFGEEYEVDKPEIEAKVPNLVMDADSSQFSTIVDVINKKNLAVEGPPGTGKSQTIVNTIATAISAGMKVLFVAEKMAALEVVRSRLDACEMGEFLLTLQANRASKAQVVQSIRDRIYLLPQRDPQRLDEKIDGFRRTRSELEKYIKIISTEYAETNFTVHDILGWGISAQDKLSEFPQIPIVCEVPNFKSITKENLREIIEVSDQFETALKKNRVHGQHWSFVNRANIDPFSADEILNLARDISRLSSNSILLRDNITSKALDKDTECNKLEKLRDGLLEIKRDFDAIDIELVKRISNERALEKIDLFFSNKEEALSVYRKLQTQFTQPLDESLQSTLSNLVEIVNEIGLQVFDINNANQIVDTARDECCAIQEEMAIISKVVSVKSFFLDKTIHAIVTTCDIASSTPRSVLAMRKKPFESPLMKVLITKLLKMSDSLKRKKGELEADYYLESFDKNEIQRNHEAFVTAGFFSMFSSKYKISKRSHISMMKHKKFVKAKAIDQSRMMLKWFEELKSFNKSNELLGDSFDGLETDYRLIESLINYYEQIQTKLSGVDNTEVREFLMRGDMELITALPEIDSSLSIRKSDHSNYESLSTKEKQLQSRILKLEEYTKDLEGFMSVFIDYRNVDFKQLPDSIKELNMFHEMQRSLNEDSEFGILLGSYYKGMQTNKAEIKSSIDMASKTVSLGRDLGAVMIQVFSDQDIETCARELESIIKNDYRMEEQISTLAQLTNAKREEIVLSRNKQELSKFLEEASNNKGGLVAISIVNANRLAFHSKGLSSIIDCLLLSEDKISGLSDIVVAVIGQLLARKVYTEYGEVLSVYDGSRLDHLRAKFAKLDNEIIKLSRKRIRAQIMEKSFPPSGIGRGRKSEWTDMALLHNEIEKKKRHVPVRDLTKRAGDALLEIKPCWMMSPLAVAQYVDKGDIAFDLVIIDEASQMTPEDSIGALSRCKQVMIVGDTNQLPPSNFFKKFIDETDDDEDEKVTEESILEMANAVFRPARRLRWHYRSRHPGLIAFSNKYVYGNDLITFPPPSLNNEKQGVAYKKVDGTYKEGTNPKEAEEIVSAIIDFMHKNNDMSLGVVVLNQKQKDLILEEFEGAISNDSVASDYVEKWEECNDGLERFFVKNLENVQGDERDVIFIGTVYGPDEQGSVMQRFGPINGITGKRRLNVLFTRAKHKIVTFSSMNSNDIRAHDGANEGAELLKYWLEYSATGKLLEVESTGREPDSVFEEYVIKQLKAIGCQPVPQVGVTGYFIDIGVKHPDWPHGFIMGVECDGATYHSTKSARDRDRLRQEVLEGLGWYLHRIWSTDWFNDPISEADRLRDVIESRLAELKNGQERKAHVDNSKGNSSSADNDESTRLGHQASFSISNKFQSSSSASSTQNNDDNNISRLNDRQEKVYYHIKEYGDKTVLETTELFCISPDTYSIKPSDVKNILLQLVVYGLIYRYESDDKEYYSTDIS